MAQWINLYRNNSFVNRRRLSLLCEKSGAVALAQPGLTAGWPAGRPAGRPSGRRNTAKFGNF